MDLLDIGALSERSGVPPSTLRYYEELGLLAPVSRRGLRRQYAPDALLQLSLIGSGKAAGFTLTEIAAVFGARGSRQIDRADLLARADRIEAQIDALAALSRALRHVAHCTAPSHLECPRFRRLLQTTARRRRRR